MMPENEAGEVPFADPDTDHDNPDEWRDVCDDETADPHEEDDG